MKKPSFLRKFCIVGLGSTEELKEDLTIISETDINFVSGEGLIIATFETSFLLPEIEDLLNLSNRSYIIFEMTMGFYSANIENKEFQDALFGGQIDNTKNPFYVIEETLKNMKEGIFMDGEKIDEILNEVNEKSKIFKTDEELLDEAIENEDYEMAAKLRDKINNENK